jgi:hypothetical protein
LLPKSEILEQNRSKQAQNRSKQLKNSSLRDEKRPNRGPDDSEQERHPPKLAEDENVNDINGIEFSRTTPIVSTDSRK